MITITETRLTAAQKRTLYHWGDDIFQVAGIDTAGLQWRTFRTGFLLSVDGVPVSYFRALRHTCQMDGQAVTVGGLGGLVTLPTQQRRGYGARLVRETVQAMRDRWRVEGALAFCLDPVLGFYQRLGALVIPSVIIETDTGPRPAPAPFHTIWWPFRPALYSVKSVDLGSPLW